MDDDVPSGGGVEGSAWASDDDRDGAGAGELSGDVDEEAICRILSTVIERADHLTLALSGKFLFVDGEMPERYQQVEEDVTGEDSGGLVAEAVNAVLRLGYMMGADDAFSGCVRLAQGSREAERRKDSSRGARLRVLNAGNPGEWVYFPSSGDTQVAQ